MENVAAVEIEIGSLRQLLLADFHKLLAKPSASHIFHRPDGDDLNKPKPDISFATKTGHFDLLPTQLGLTWLLKRAFECTHDATRLSTRVGKLFKRD